VSPAPARRAITARQTRRTRDIDDTPLGRIQTAFQALSTRDRPAPLRIPAAVLEGDHDRQMITPWDLSVRLRARLETGDRLTIDGHHIIDRVWWHLAGRARRDGGEWLLVAAGMAAPGLRAMVPATLSRPVKILVQADMIARLIEALTGVPVEAGDPDQADTGAPVNVTTFDITTPYLFHRLMDRIRYAAIRSSRRLSAPRVELSHEAAAWELDRDAAGDNPSGPPSRAFDRDPLPILTDLVAANALIRLDASLLGHAYLCGRTQTQTFIDVRASLPTDVAEHSKGTDTALRGRLERARFSVLKYFGDDIDQYRTRPDPPPPDDPPDPSNDAPEPSHPTPDTRPPAIPRPRQPTAPQPATVED
jgi:hypothetical protein